MTTTKARNNADEKNNGYAARRKAMQKEMQMKNKRMHI
jgi:hypothetical protein